MPMKIKRNNKNREYSKELAFDVETFIEANEGNFQKEFESYAEATGINVSCPDQFHEYVYSEFRIGTTKQIMSELYLLYISNIPTDEEMERDDKENLAKDARGNFS